MESNILQMNETIAEFMGTRKEIPVNSVTPRFALDGKTYLNYQLDYHTDWNWLMPVWAKCKEIGLWMYINNHDKLWIEKSREIDAAIVHEIDCSKACMLISNLIEWYNQQNNTTCTNTEVNE
jgi:hypothetical protein